MLYICLVLCGVILGVFSTAVFFYVIYKKEFYIIDKLAETDPYQLKIVSTTKNVFNHIKLTHLCRFCGCSKGRSHTKACPHRLAAKLCDKEAL